MCGPYLICGLYLWTLFVAASVRPSQKDTVFYNLHYRPHIITNIGHPNSTPLVAFLIPDLISRKPCISGPTPHLPFSMPPTSLCTGERNPIRIPWAKRLHRSVIITAKTAIECDDIVVLALYSQLARRSPARRHNTSTLSLHPDVPWELRARIRSLYEESKKTVWHQDQTQQGLLKATTALFADIWESSRELLVNLHGVYGARKALRWSDLHC